MSPSGHLVELGVNSQQGWQSGQHLILKHCGAIHKCYASAGSQSITYTGTFLHDAFIIHLSRRVLGFAKPPIKLNALAPAILGRLFLKALRIMLKVRIMCSSTQKRLTIGKGLTFSLF